MRPVPELTAQNSRPRRQLPLIVLFVWLSSSRGWGPPLDYRNAATVGIIRRARAPQQRLCVQKWASFGSASQHVVNQFPILYATSKLSQQTINTTDVTDLDEETRGVNDFLTAVQTVFLSRPTRSVLFSVLMALSGAFLGPFLDSYHSLSGVLQYDAPITAILWGTDIQHPALVTTDWVPALFGLAGILIGWLYIVLDEYFSKAPLSAVVRMNNATTPSPPKILLGVAIFTFQYWWSAALYHAGVDRSVIFAVMALSALGGFWWLDKTLAGLITSVATAIGGPIIEIILLTLSKEGVLFDGKGYHYNDLGETGFFPLWIVPVYFLGGPANGNLARGFWKLTSSSIPASKRSKTTEMPTPCIVCNDTRCVSCPNCDGIGNYIAMGDRLVQCKACNGRGFVVCRTCFEKYNEDPYDLESIRKLMSRMPD